MLGRYKAQVFLLRLISADLRRGEVRAAGMDFLPTPPPLPNPTHLPYPSLFFCTLPYLSPPSFYRCAQTMGPWRIPACAELFKSAVAASRESTAKR